MSAWLISALDRLPAQVRRVAVTVAALLLIGGAIAALLIAPSPGGGVRLRGPIARAPVYKSSPPAPPRRPAPPVPAGQLRRARDAAERFLGSYLAFAYGRGRAVVVRAVAPALGRELAGERARITPVERRRHPRLVSLRAVGMTPGFALATAMIDDGGITAYPLRFTLQESAGRWAVSSVQEG